MRCLLPLGGDAALFFVLLYLYVWLVVDPRLVHHSLGILSEYYPFEFHSGWAFFLDHLAVPGGLVQYAARFLTQFYGIGWAGAAIITGAAAFACFAADALGRVAGRPRGRVLRFVPAVLLLGLYGGYSHPIHTLLPVLTAVAGFLIFARWAPQKLGARLLTVALASAATFQVAGAGAAVFSLLAAVYECFIARRPASGAAAIVCALVVPWGLATLASLDMSEAFAGPLLSDPGVLPVRQPLAIAWTAFFPALLATAVLAQAVLNRRQSRVAGNRRDAKRGSERSRGKAGRGAHPEASRRAAWMRRLTDRAFSRASRRAIPVASAGLVLLGAAAVGWLSLDTLARTILEIDFHSQREHWEETLASAAKLPPGTYNVRCNRNIALALYHTGRLGDELFGYPQRPGIDLFNTPGRARDLGSYYQESRLLLQLGQVNQAEKNACEALETRGELPSVLEELAWINVVKGRPETARIFLNALAQQPLHRRAATGMLDQLDASPGMDDDPRIAGVRRNAVASDDVAMETTIEGLLEPLLEKNPQNRMAFEFLMTHYLVVGRLDRAMACLARLKDFAYPAIPRHYQEAALIYAQAAGKRSGIPGYALDAEVVAQASRFARILAHAPSRSAAAEAAREAGFGDSYFYYFTFGIRGS